MQKDYLLVVTCRLVITSDSAEDAHKSIDAGLYNLSEYVEDIEAYPLSNEREGYGTI